MPLPTMPMSIVRCISCVVMNAPITPPAAPSMVTTATSAKRTSRRAQRRARVEAEPADEQDQDAQADERHGVTRDRPRLAVGAVLALARAEQQQRRERAGRADEVDRGRAGEVLHAGQAEVVRKKPPVCSQPPPNTQWAPIG